MARHFLPYDFSYKNERVEFVVDDQYDALNIINKGGQGHIIKAYDRNNQNLVAVKKIRQTNDLINAKRVYREFMISRAVRHRNLITLLDAFAPLNGTDFYLVYEFMDASMRDLMDQNESHPNNFKKMVWDPDNGDCFTANILFQLFCGLRYLHQDKLRFIHRDLKPDNILFKQLSGENWVLKICDLGLARHLRENELNISMYVVTWPYRAPEIMISDSYDFAVDLWSVGCILAEMITGYLLFRRTNQKDHFFRIVFIVGIPEDTQLPGFLQADLDQNQNLYGPNRVDAFFTDDKLPNWTNQRITKQFVRGLLRQLLEFKPTERLTAEQGMNLCAFDFLENKRGMNDVASKSYNPEENNWPDAEVEWMEMLRRELDAYETERFERSNLQRI